MHSLIRVIESQLAVPYVKSEPVAYDIGYSLTRYGIVLVARVSGLGGGGRNFCLIVLYLPEAAP